jgi:hypothetical protein
MQNFGFDVITLLVPTFHALQPLNVNCLKPFKIAFKTNAMVRNKHCELNKCIMIGQVGKSLDQSLPPKKSKVSSKLQEFNLSIPRPWTKRPQHFVYTQQWLQTFQMKTMMILME